MFVKTTDILDLFPPSYFHATFHTLLPISPFPSPSELIIFITSLFYFQLVCKLWFYFYSLGVTLTTHDEYLT